MIQSLETAPDAGEISRLLQESGKRLDFAGQLNAMFPPAAAMMMRPDARLIHPRDHRRPAARTHRRRHKSTGEARPAVSEGIDVGRGDESLTVAGKIRRHVVNDEPEDVRTILCRDRLKKSPDKETAQQNHNAAGV